MSPGETNRRPSGDPNDPFVNAVAAFGRARVNRLRLLVRGDFDLSVSDPRPLNSPPSPPTGGPWPWEVNDRRDGDKCGHDTSDRADGAPVNREVEHPYVLRPLADAERWRPVPSEGSGVFAECRSLWLNMPWRRSREPYLPVREWIVD